MKKTFRATFFILRSWSDHLRNIIFYPQDMKNALPDYLFHHPLADRPAFPIL